MTKTLQRLLPAFLALWLAFGPVQAWAAFGSPYQIGSVSSTATASTAIVTTTADVAAGDTMVAWLRLDVGGGTIVSIQDAVNLTNWTCDTQTSTTSINIMRMCYFKTSVAVPASTNITITYGASTAQAKQAIIMAFSGANTLDQVASSSGNSASPTITIPMLSNANELLVAGILTSTSNTRTPPGSWTQCANYPATTFMNMWCLVVNSTSSVSPSWTLASSANWGMHAMTFTQATTEGAPQRSFLGVGR